MNADSAAQMYGPVGGGAAPVASQKLANSGTTESHNSTALSVGKYATLLVGCPSAGGTSNPVRFSLRAAAGAAAQVATDSPSLPANGRLDWLVTTNTCYVYVEAADGSSAYECHVWTSSPG